jgi:hypothetical protein
VFSLVALPNGELLSGGGDGTVKRWGRDGQQVGTTISSGVDLVTSMLVLPNGELLIGGGNGYIFKHPGTHTHGGNIQPISVGGREGAVISLVKLFNAEPISFRDDATVVARFVKHVDRQRILVIQESTSPLVAVAKRGCVDLQGHSMLRNPQTPAQRAARDTCRRLGVLKE